MDKNKIFDDAKKMLELTIGALRLLKQETKKEVKELLKTNNAQTLSDLKDTKLYLLGFGLTEDIELLGLKIEELDVFLDDLEDFKLTEI